MFIYRSELNNLLLLPGFAEAEVYQKLEELSLLNQRISDSNAEYNNEWVH